MPHFIYEADLALLNTRLFHPVFRRFVSADLYVKDGRIFRLDFEAKQETREAVLSTLCLDLKGAELVPGLVDLFAPIELSLLTPRTYAAALLSRGVTTVVTEPRAAATLFGTAGIRDVLRTGKACPVDLFLSLPAAVPSTRPDLEKTPELLNAEEWEELVTLPEVVAVGEIRNGQLAKEKDGSLPLFRLLKSLEKTKPRPRIEGCLSGLAGLELSRYLQSGIDSDRLDAGTTLEDIKEKLHQGLFLKIQEKALHPELLRYLCSDVPAGQFALISGERLPDELLEKGQLDAVLRRAVELGMPRETALYCASESPATYMNLNDRGRLRPGCLADFSVLKEGEIFTPAAVFKNGLLRYASEEFKRNVLRKVADNPVFDATESPRQPFTFPSAYKQSLRLPLLRPEDFVLRRADLLRGRACFSEEEDLPLDPAFRRLYRKLRLASDPFFAARCHSADAAPAPAAVCPPPLLRDDHDLLSLRLRCMHLSEDRSRVEERTVTLPYSRRRDVLLLDGEEGSLAKLCVLCRGAKPEERRLALVEGDLLCRGAVATSLSLESRHIAILGHSDEDMSLVARRLSELGGGIVLAEGGKILAELPLELAGVMTEASLEECAASCLALRQAFARLGCRHENPLMSLANLTHLLSPDLRLSDKGLIDVAHAQRLPLLPDTVLPLEAAETQELLAWLHARHPAPDTEIEALPAFCGKAGKEGELELRVVEHRPADPEKERVESYRFLIFYRGKAAGGMSLRCSFFPHLLSGGHIGYAINPAFRGKNLLSLAFEALRPLMKHYGFRYAVIANAVWNYSSRSVCRKLGAHYLGCFQVPEDQRIRQHDEKEYNAFLLELRESSEGFEKIGSQ